jgi:hypothetical protein
MAIFDPELNGHPLIDVSQLKHTAHSAGEISCYARDVIRSLIANGLLPLPSSASVVP